MVRQDRGNDIKGGGLCFLVHQTIPFQRCKTPPSLASDPHIEELTIQVESNQGKPVIIRNIYIPPVSSCEQGYTPPISSLADGLTDDSILLGDLNAHSHLWFSRDNEDTRGRQIADWINDSDLGVCNEDTATRSTATSNTAPDLSLATSNLLPTCSWTVNSALSSDHLPIHLSLTTQIKKTSAPNKTFVNFKKANWPGFRNFIENKLSSAEPQDDPHKGELFLRQIINKASKIYIPAGRIPKILNAVPSETAKLIEERDKLRSEDPSNDRLRDMNTNINKKINEHRKEKWLEQLKDCTPGSKKLWDTVKGLGNNSAKQSNNQSIKFNSVHYNHPKKLAMHFNRQFTPEANTKPTQAFRNLLRTLRKKNKKDVDVIFTPDQTKEVIKKCKNSKAMGPDGISPIMLKQLGPKAISYLTHTINRVLNTSIIPPLWKVGRIIPLLKPGKPSDEGTSYRPISLLSPAAKTLEALVLKEIQDAIPLADHQHGFRKGRSTATALQEINTHIQQGLNKKKPADRTVLVAIDLSKAFDTVNLETLLKDFSSLHINQNIKRFMAAYLRGRQTYVEFRDGKSKLRKMRQGVPQGGVLSPVLFNLYMAKMPMPPGNIKLITYADDSTVLYSGPKLDPLCLELNTYLGTLHEWFLNRNLQISAPKSSATVFTTFSNEVSKTLDININGQKVPTIKDPKILGVTYDPLLTFKNHATNLKEKLKSKNNILKALSGTSWGKDKECLLTTFKATSKSLINYCAPVWTPSLSDTNWQEIQVGQNANLRTVLGNVKMAHQDHLHAEAKEMPVKKHCEMLSKQFLLSTTKENHPNKTDLSHVPPRTMKQTLTTRFGTEILDLIPEGGTTTSSYKSGLKRIHTTSVDETIRLQTDNRVLQRPAPPHQQI